MEASFFEQCHRQLEADLQPVRQDNPHPEHWSAKSIPIVQECLAALKVHLQAHPFKRRSEEITFFKEMKPSILGKLIFFVEVFNASIQQPIKTDYKKQKKYWKERQIIIGSYFEEHKAFYDYLQENMTELDNQLFVRYPKDPLYHHHFQAVDQDPVSFYGDPAFSTSHDYRTAKFRAYEDLQGFIQEQLDDLEGKALLPPEKWEFTGSPDDFVEFIRLFEGKVTNNKTGEPATREEIARHILQFLDADLGGFSDYKTLELCSNGSDFSERMQEKMEELRAEWEAEEEDVEYGPDGRE